MKKTFLVTMERMAWQQVTIEVEAESPDHAEELVANKAIGDIGNILSDVCFPDAESTWDIIDTEEVVLS